MSDIDITKITIKLKDKHPVKIFFNRTTDTGVIEPTEHPGEALPHRDLIEALDGFMELAIAANRLDPEAWQQAAFEDNAHVTGLSIKEDGSTPGINITLVGKFTNEDGTVDCSTQNKFVAYEQLSPNDHFALQRTIAEAKAYMNGKFSGGTQGSLFDQAEELVGV